MITIKNLNKTYYSNSKVIHALKNVNMSLDRGKIVSVIGKNGAGKTTLIKSCIDLLTYSGDILYNSSNLQMMTPKNKISTYSALLEGSRNLYWKLTSIENIRYFASLRGILFSEIDEIVTTLFGELNIENKKNELVENLSKGMQQKISFICAVAMSTPVIFLDEPTLGLDCESNKAIIDLLRNHSFFKNKLVIISSHDYNFVEIISDQIFHLEKGYLLHKKPINNNHYICRIGNYNDNVLFIKEVIEVKDSNKYELYLDCDKKSLGDVITEIEGCNINITYIKKIKFDTDYFYLH